MRGASEARALALAALEGVWAAIFELYSARPAIGVLGAEVVELALEAEELIARDLTGAQEALRRARELLSDLGAPAA